MQQKSINEMCIRDSNNNFREQIEAKGMMITGTSPTGELVETVEIPNHPFYIGVQFHPEDVYKRQI